MTDPDHTARRLRAVERIRKLLRLSEDQRGQPEGDAAQARAEALMKLWGLAEGTLSLEADAGFDHQAFDLGMRQQWRRDLATVVAEWFDCVLLYRSAEVQVHVYGPNWALPQVEYTYMVYLRQLVSAWRAQGQKLCDEGTWDRLSSEGRFERRRNFCVSFMRGVRERLIREKAREAQEDPEGHALMRDERRTLEHWLAEGGIRWQRRAGAPSAWSEQGYQAGLSAEVRQGVRGPRRGPRQLTG